MGSPEDPLALTLGDKFKAGLMASVALVWCGPFLFLVLAVAVIALLMLPASLIGAQDSTWLYVLGAVLAAILTVLLLIAFAAGKVQEEKEKRLIRDAEVERARAEIEERRRERE